MSDKKEEKTSGWLQRAVHRAKTWLPAGLIMLGPTVSTHAETPELTPDTGKKTQTTVNISTSDNDRLVEVEHQLNQYSSKVYKGLTIDLSTIKPQDVAHIFESGMNPCVTDGNKPLSRASYLGLCQMDLRGTLQKFVKQSADEFPELQAAVSKHGIRSAAFMSAWKKYSYGPQAKQFEQKQFDYMWDVNYKKIFDNLSATGSFPKVTKENYADAENFIYSAAVISCANQSPRGTAGIFKQARASLGKNADIADVAIKTYDIKTKKWGLKSRYREESKLLKDKKQQLQLSKLYLSLKNPNALAYDETPRQPTVRPISIAELNNGKIQIEPISTAVLDQIKNRAPQKRSEKSTVLSKQTLALALNKRKNSRG